MTPVTVTIVLANGTLPDATQVNTIVNDILAGVNANILDNSYLWTCPTAAVAAPGADADVLRFNPPHAAMKMVHVTGYCETNTVTVRIRYSIDNFATSTDLILAGTAIFAAGVATSLSGGAVLNTGLAMGPGGQIRYEITAAGAGAANFSITASLKGLFRTNDNNP